jgi:transposase-like protein
LPEVIRLVVMMYERFPWSLRNVEDLLLERGIEICHETVRHWWSRFGQMKTLQKFASVHASLHNHFNQERHLTDRQTYKERRSAAFAEWSNLAA